MIEEEFFSLRGVADRLKVSEQTVRRWVKAGQLKAYKPGLEYRILSSDLDKFLESHTPKAQAPPSPPPAEEAASEEERRIHYLKPWSNYVNLLANNIEREIDRGNVTSLAWAHEFSRDVISLTHLYNRTLPPPEEQTESERVELLKFSDAIDKLNEVADKMDSAMEPVISQMHEDLYAKEREMRKAEFEVFQGGRRTA